MNIKQIYNKQKTFFEEKISEMYNDFVKKIEEDTDYSLSDDELTELFNELLLRYVKNTMSEYEFKRVLDNFYN